MTATELRALGERMYGRHWQGKLASAIPVSTRSIRYWLSGKHTIRPAMGNRIRDIAEKIVD